MNQEPHAPQTAPDRELEKRQTLWILLALAFVEGWFSWIIGEKSSWMQPYTLLVNLVNIIFIVRWFVLDAAQRHFKLTQMWIFFFVLMALFAAPWYFFKTRGAQFWRPSGLAALFLLAIMVSATMGAVAAQLLKL